jgi:hypothetical protein
LPLSKAAREARSPFLKCEAFRLLSLLFAAKIDPETSDSDKVAFSKLHECGEAFVGAVVAAMEDEEMKKTKRVRTVLKTMEKFVSSLSSPCSPILLTRLGAVKKLLAELKESGGKAIMTTCTKLSDEIGSKIAELETAKEEEEKVSPSKKAKKQQQQKKKKNNRKS